MRNLLIAFLNLKSYKKFYYKYIFLIAALLLLITLFYSYYYGLKDLQERKKNESFSSNYLITLKEMDDKINFHSKEEWKVYDFRKNKNEEENNIFPILNFFEIELEVDGRITFTNSYDKFGSIISGNIELLISENDIREYDDKNELLIIGDLPKKDNEILISEELLKSFSLNSSIINKEIRLINKETKEKNAFVLKITGIIKSEYYNLSGHDSGFIPIIVGNNNFIFNQNNIKIYRYNLDKFLEKTELETLFEEKNIYYGAYFLLDIIMNIMQMQIITIKLFTIATGALCFGIIMILLLMSFELIKIFSKNSGILKLCGVRNNNLYIIFVLQLLIVFFISTIISLFLNFVILKLLNLLIYKMYVLEIKISLSLLFNSWLLSIFVSFFSLIVLVSVAFRKNRDKTIRSLLISQ